MKRIHPNANQAAALVALALSLAVGCRNQSGGMANPFLAPGRVPPPATRALLPGQAQPYYPGDPLPVMQSGTGPTAGANAFAAGASLQMPTADTNLTWTTPGSTAPATNPSPEPRAVVASGEPTVAIPADGDSLRFALPAPIEPEAFTPIAPVALAAPQSRTQFSAAPMAQGVVPASYNAPLDSSVQAAAFTPWQSPQIAASPSIAPTASPYWPASQSPVITVTNNMDVRLRAVTSPSIEPVTSSTPRIRIPGYLPAPPTIGANDGFRPRSSMR